jgi:hypothetical protein
MRRPPVQRGAYCIMRHRLGRSAGQVEGRDSEGRTRDGLFGGCTDTSIASEPLPSICPVCAPAKLCDLRSFRGDLLFCDKLCRIACFIPERPRRALAR